MGGVFCFVLSLSQIDKSLAVSSFSSMQCKLLQSSSCPQENIFSVLRGVIQMYQIHICMYVLLRML